MSINEWEAKYKALAAGIQDKNLITNAEFLVRTALDLSSASPEPFDVVFYGMLQVVGLLQPKPELDIKLKQ